MDSKSHEGQGRELCFMFGMFGMFELVSTGHSSCLVIVEEVHFGCKSSRSKSGFKASCARMPTGRLGTLEFQPRTFWLEVKQPNRSNILPWSSPEAWSHWKM